MKRFSLFLVLVLGIGFFALSPIARAGQSVTTEPQITLAVGDYEETLARREFLSWTHMATFLVIDPDRKTEIENPRYCSTDFVFCALTTTTRDSAHLMRVTRTTVATEHVKEFLDDLARRANTDPVDAKFAVHDGRATAFVMSRNGARMDIEKSAAKISVLLTNDSVPPEHITLPFDPVEPTIRTTDSNKLGITELIGEGRSNFAGSSADRIHNITVAANRFHGILIKPGEEFSFVKILGPVDEEHGYKPELVIRDHQTKPEYGGGICQVSTTIFRGAILSGLDITARRNHSYPVRYYQPIGFDATVYDPFPDLRFRNNTPGHILLQMYREGTQLIFDFYGTNDGRRTVMEGPFVTERNPDGSMKTYFVQKVFDKNDTLVNEETFKSAYKSPNDYPKPEDIAKMTKKPNGWSDREWQEYKKAAGV